MSTETYTGWEGCTNKAKIVSRCGCLELDHVYPEKGNETDWLPEDWPPNQVRIIIEREERHDEN